MAQDGHKPKMRSVAIIGAGPFGLATARSFLRKKPRAFDVAVFDKQDRVGGMWAVSPGEQHKMLNPEMPTNISRFAVSFADLSWRSVDLSHPSKSSRPGFLPIFPRAWQVGRYLKTYAEKWVPRDVLHLGCEVTEAVELCVGDHKRWKVTWQELSSGRSRAQYFDHLVIASGFFATPRPSDLASTVNSDSDNSSRVMKVHSSRCRSMSGDVAPDRWDGNGSILVVGGSMSGAEAATALAFQVSDRKYAPGATSWGNPKVIHVIPRQFYAVPPILATPESAKDASFLPSDLYFFNLDRRPPSQPIHAGFGRMPTERARKAHAGLRNMIGDQQDLGSPALVAESVDNPAYVAITAGGMYSEFVRQGLIEPVAGRVTGFSEADSQAKATATVHNEGSDTYIEHIAGVVYATGYTPMPVLGFLSQDVQQKLELDRDAHRLPVILQDYQTFHPEVPNLGFVGFYEAPYWSVAEMQARLLAERWSGETLKTNSELSAPKQDITLAEQLRHLRKAMKEKASDVPQYWNGDTVGLLEEMSRALSITRSNDIWPGQTGPISISRYCDHGTDQTEAQKSREDLHQLLERCHNDGLFVSWAAFRGMQGQWKMHRELKSDLASMPSGTFVGTGQFHRRVPTSDDCDGEYLYIEEGDFETTTGFKMRASRRYAFRYHEMNDKITSWFVKEDGSTVDYLFLDLMLQPRVGSRAMNSWMATSTHPCAPDTYDATYDWHFTKSALAKFTVVYKVKGPLKDYTSTTSFLR